MHDYFEIKNNKVSVIDTKGNVTERELLPNIEDILICENNIEEINKEIERQNDSCKNAKKIKKNSIYYFVNASISSASCILGFLNGSLFLGFSQLFLASMWLTVGYFFTYKFAKRNLKFNEKQLEIYKEQLNIEEIKLANLKDFNPNKKRNNNATQKIITKSETIAKLEKQIYLINTYKLSKKEILKAYKKGNLDNFLINLNCFIFKDNETIKFIKELIKWDLNNENTNENNKVKTKKI